MFGRAGLITVRSKRVGIVLVLLSILVGILWLVTGTDGLEPLAFVLGSLGALLLAL